MRHAYKGLLLLTFLTLLLLMPTGLHSQELIEAAERGDTAAVRALLDAGADVNATTNEGETALAMAQRLRHTEIVEILQNAGAN